MTDYRFAVYGCHRVGKSVLTIQFVYNHFLEVYDQDIEDGYRKAVIVDGEQIYIHVLDCVLGEDYTSMREMWLRKNDGILLIYDITNRESFEQLDSFCDEIQKLQQAADKKELSIVICGNKCDLEDQRQVTTEEGKKFADLYGYPFYETSAKTNINVNEAFFALVRNYLPNNNINGDSGKHNKCIIC